MPTEEEQFEEIAKKSQHLFKDKIEVFKETVPTGIYVPPKIGEKPLLPILDPNLDLVNKVSQLLHTHDITKESIYEYQKEKIKTKSLCVHVTKALRDLSVVEEFKNIYNKLNKLLEETYLSPESRAYACVSYNEIDDYNKTHPNTTFILELNKILQEIHSISLDVLSEYNMMTKTYVDEKGIEHTKTLYFLIGHTRVINIEPYNIDKNVIGFINAFNEEVNKSGYNTYLNILFVPLDKKYRLDISLGAAFAHRSIIIYDLDPSIEYFEHIYADTNYSRTLAWKKYIEDFSYKNEKIDIQILEEEKKPPSYKSLAWQYTLMKSKIDKEFLSSLAIIIYLINWDGVINHSSHSDIMDPLDEAEIIYFYGIYPEYNEKEERYTVKYNIETQKAIRKAIQDTVRGIENKLLPE